MEFGENRLKTDILIVFIWIIAAIIIYPFINTNFEAQWTVGPDQSGNSKPSDIIIIYEKLLATSHWFSPTGQYPQLIQIILHYPNNRHWVLRRHLYLSNLLLLILFLSMLNYMKSLFEILVVLKKAYWNSSDQFIVLHPFVKGLLYSPFYGYNWKIVSQLPPYFDQLLQPLVNY